ncbi:MAG: DHA2 family efflux MFS transporter permease subunit [Chloroflexota bacterium]
MKRPTINEENYKWWGLTALLIGTFVVSLGLSLLFPAMPVIMADFQATVNDVAWLSIAYAVAFAALQPVMGRLSDLYGRKRLFIGGMLTFLLGSGVAALSWDILSMAVARFVQGIGAAAIFPAGMAYIGEMFSREERGKAMGIWGIASGAAPAIGPLLGGYLVDWGGWRSLYYFSVFIGVVAVLAPWFILRPSKTQKVSGFDLAGSAWLFVGVGSILVVLNEGRNWGWTSPTIIGLLVTFGACLIAFLIHESRTRNPIADVDLLKSPFFLLLAGTAFVSFIAMQGAMFLIPFFWQNVQGYTPSDTGMMVVPLFVAMAIFSMLGGTLADRLGIRWTAALGMLAKTLALLLLGFLVIDTPYWYAGLALGVLGIGMGIALPPLSKAIVGGVSPRKMGAASGMFSMVRNLGGPFGVAILSSVFAGRTADHVRALAEEFGPEVARLHGMAAAFGEAFLVAAGFCALGVVMALFVREARAQEVVWSREALALLQKIPSEFRARARRGLETTAQGMGVKVVTPELVVEIGRGWRARQPEL